jgi:hypothetical protein
MPQKKAKKNWDWWNDGTSPMSAGDTLTISVWAKPGTNPSGGEDSHKKWVTASASASGAQEFSASFTLTCLDCSNAAKPKPTWQCEGACECGYFSANNTNFVTGESSCSRSHLEVHTTKYHTPQPKPSDVSNAAD